MLSPILGLECCTPKALECHCKMFICRLVIASFPWACSTWLRQWPSFHLGGPFLFMMREIWVSGFHFGQSTFTDERERKKESSKYGIAHKHKSCPSYLDHYQAHKIMSPGVEQKLELVEWHWNGHKSKVEHGYTELNWKFVMHESWENLHKGFCCVTHTLWKWWEDISNIRDRSLKSNIQPHYQNGTVPWT